MAAVPSFFYRLHFNIHGSANPCTGMAEFFTASVGRGCSNDTHSNSGWLSYVGEASRVSTRQNLDWPELDGPAQITRGFLGGRRGGAFVVGSLTEAAVSQSAPDTVTRLHINSFSTLNHGSRWWLGTLKVWPRATSLVSLEQCHATSP